MKPIQCVCLSSVVLLTCSSSAADQAAWKYGYSIHSRGSRSESISGVLSYRGQGIPAQFGHVITPIGEFVFLDTAGFSVAKREWLPAFIDQKGSVCVPHRGDEAKALLSGEGRVFRKTRIEKNPATPSTKACLLGTFENPPKDAGADWFFVVDQNLWVNPAKIAEVELKPAVGTPGRPSEPAAGGKQGPAAEADSSPTKGGPAPLPEKGK